MNKSQWIIPGAFVVSAVLWQVISLSGGSEPIAWTASITLFTAILWVSEVIPIPVASMIPFVGFPVSGVLTHKEAASALGSHVILLLMGAFMLSKALERSQVHHRFALYMIQLTGQHSASRLVFAFMLTAALLSMWISNTATTLMMLPIALAIIKSVDEPKLAAPLLLGIAYAASLGGVGTPIGTPPNIIFMSVYQENTGYQYDFLDWMKIGVPIVVLGIPLMALWLTRNLHYAVNFKLPESGPWKTAEKRVLWVFATVALAWVFRPYWSQWLDVKTVGDSTIALAGVVVMFIVSSGEKSAGNTNEKLLDWKTATDIPWGMLLLFAGGICIAKAFVASGLSLVMADLLSAFSTFPLLLLLLSICLFVTFLTEITSNTATATLLMPVLASVGLALEINPALLMIPAAISASCAFMLPVATAPNAIVYGTETFTIKQMAREGALLNVGIALIVTLVCYVILG